MYRRYVIEHGRPHCLRHEDGIAISSRQNEEGEMDNLGSRQGHSTDEASNDRGGKGLGQAQPWRGNGWKVEQNLCATRKRN